MEGEQSNRREGQEVRGHTLPGYRVRVFNKQRYIVPRVLEPSTEVAVTARQEAANIKAMEKEGGVSYAIHVLSYISY